MDERQFAGRIREWVDSLWRIDVAGEDADSEGT